MKSVLTIIFVVAIAASMTVPTRQQAESRLRAQLLAALGEHDPSLLDRASETALTACEAEADACDEALDPAVAITFDDRKLYSWATLDGLGYSARCLGLFTQYICQADRG